MTSYINIKTRPINNLYYCNSCNLPTTTRNYCTFNENEVDYFVQNKEKSIESLANILKESKDEKQITEALYILNKLADEKVKGIEKLYPVLSKLNNTDSPNIQTYLAGIYRKIQIPDAFGPLVRMLIQNSIKTNNSNQTFDPNEEIGGAILSYISDRFKH